MTILTSASGFTASSKGNDALVAGMRGLWTAANNRGANAVVGLTFSMFGAGGGITNALGGDAVGVLIAGTAAVVEPNGEATEAVAV